MSVPTGTLFIIAAPSGAGKTSLVNALVSSTSDMLVSISHTTRPPRSKELHGRNYHFIDQYTFVAMQERNEFLESAQVFDYYYGTSRCWVEEQLATGKDVILEIDWQGAAIVKKNMPACVGIFILPPARDVLLQRLQERAQDDDTVIARRMQAAQSEMSHYHEFDYVIVNDVFDVALKSLQHIVLSQRLRLHIQAEKQKSLLKDLLSN